MSICGRCEDKTTGRTDGESAFQLATKSFFPMPCLHHAAPRAFFLYKLSIQNKHKSLRSVERQRVSLKKAPGAAPYRSCSPLFGITHTHKRGE